MSRSARIWIAAAVVAALAVVGVLVALSASGGSSGGANGDVARAADDAKALFAGVRQRGEALGRPAAPVTVTEYADLQCPVCREAALTLLPHVLTRWVRPGTVRMVLRPLTFIGPDSERGALATEAAGAQRRAWTYADTLYRVQGKENSGWLDDDIVTAAARALGLDAQAFDRDRAGAAAAAALRGNEAAFQAIGGSATPTFVIAGPGGRGGFAGLPTSDAFDRAVTQARGS